LDISSTKDRRGPDRQVAGLVSIHHVINKRVLGYFEPSRQGVLDCSIVRASPDFELVQPNVEAPAGESHVNNGVFTSQLGHDRLLPFREQTRDAAIGFARNAADL
jgi:hypothetical protein